MSEEASTQARQRVWDPLVRGLHWLLAAGVLIAWISGHWVDLVEPWFDFIHHGAGYLVLAVAVLRALWGFASAGPRARFARFAQFVQGPRAVLAYWRQLRNGREPRYLGHNPLGGWMVLALLLTAAALSITGMLYVGDWLWGYEWLWLLHAGLAWLLAGLVIGHWIGVAFTGWRHRENLVGAMFSGIKRAARPEDIA